MRAKNALSKRHAIVPDLENVAHFRRSCSAALRFLAIRENRGAFRRKVTLLIYCSVGGEDLAEFGTSVRKGEFPEISQNNSGRRKEGHLSQKGGWYIMRMRSRVSVNVVVTIHIAYAVKTESVEQTSGACRAFFARRCDIP